MYIVLDPHVYCFVLFLVYQKFTMINIFGCFRVFISCPVAGTGLVRSSAMAVPHLRLNTSVVIDPRLWKSLLESMCGVFSFIVRSCCKPTLFRISLIWKPNRTVFHCLKQRFGLEVKYVIVGWVLWLGCYLESFL